MAFDQLQMEQELGIGLLLDEVLVVVEVTEATLLVLEAFVGCGEACDGDKFEVVFLGEHCVKNFLASD